MEVEKRWNICKEILSTCTAWKMIIMRIYVWDVKYMHSIEICNIVNIDMEI